MFWLLKLRLFYLDFMIVLNKSENNRGGNFSGCLCFVLIRISWEEPWYTKLSM